MGADTVDIDRAWRQREDAKSNERPVPWAAEQWFIDSEIAAHHYAHVSADDSSKLAYTPDARHGREDRQLRTRAGRYLNKYFADVLTPPQIAAYAGAFAGANESNEIQFASTPDEIERIYVEGPRSCMSRGADDYDTGGIHPCRAYGAGDLSIAYIIRDGAISARTLVWPERKLRATIYGDHARLTPLLDAAGYTTSGNFDGAKLLRLEVSSGGFAAPYMDGGYAAYDDGENLVIARGGDFQLANTGGVVNNGFYCHCCEESCDGEERTVGGETWCEGCEENSSIYCECCQESQRDYNARHVGDDMYCEDCFDSHAAVCERCQEASRAEDVLTVHNGMSASAEWCEDCRDSHAIHCERCEESHVSDYGRCVGDETWCEECAGNHAIRCERCDESVQSDDSKTVAIEKSVISTGDETWCDDCADSDATDCADCGELWSIEDMAPYSSGGELRCEDCFDDNFAERIRRIMRGALRMLPAQASRPRAAAPVLVLLPARAGARPAPTGAPVLDFAAALAPTLRASARVAYAPMRRRSA